jgi:TldD protein
MTRDMFAAAGIRAYEYAEVRTEQLRVLELLWRGDAAETATVSHEEGACARVVGPDGWSFASASTDDPGAVLAAAAAQARLMHRACPGFRTDPVPGDTTPPPVGPASTADLRTSDKASVLGACHAAAISGHSAVTGALLYYREVVRDVQLRTSHGRQIEYRHRDVACSLSVYAADGGTTATGLVSLGGGDFATLGDLRPQVDDAVRSAVELLSAPPVPAGMYDVVCDGALAGVWAHETLGHAAEADHAADDDAVLFQPGAVVGPDILTIGDGPGRPGARGYVPVDDEGHAGQDVVLIDHGRATGARLHSGLTAAAWNQPLTGNARALDYRYPPLPRLRTITVQPGPHTLPQMIGETGRGIYASGFSGGQTDRMSFTFNPAECRLIEDGQLRGRVRGAVLSGGIADAVARVDRVGDTLWSGDTSAACGKQGQWPLPVSSWAPAIRLRGLHVRAG